MTTGPGRQAVTDRLGAADERELAVIAQAGVRGLLVAMHCLLVLALVLALFGNWLVPAVLLVIITVTGRAVASFAEQRHVDIDWLMTRSGSLVAKSREGAYVVVATVATLAAMSFVGFTGHGLLHGPEIVATGPAADAILRTAAQSVPLGAILGLLLSEAVAAVKQRRMRTRPVAPDDDQDD